ncbi:hypothetical protein BH24GEM3_BH24GEM3_20600 [soil metagenome]
MPRLAIAAQTALLAVVCACAPALPSPTLAPAGEASGLRLVGWSDLGGGGLNGRVAIVGTTAVVAAGIAPAAGSYANVYSPYPCPAVEVKLVSVADPREPRVVGTIPVQEGLAALDVAAMRVETPSFRGDLAAVALVRCGEAGFGVDRGVVYYEITDPRSPRLLGRYDADADRFPPEERPPCAMPPEGRDAGCAASQYAVQLVRRADGRILSLSAEPGASASNFPSGDLRIVEVTNPRNPVQLGSFPPPGRPIWSPNGCRPFSAGRGAAVAQGGEFVALTYYDDGLFLLDIQDPASPRVLGRLPYSADRQIEGNAAHVALAEVGGRRLALVAEEDWIAPSTRLRLEAPEQLAAELFACQAIFTLFDPRDRAQLFRHPDSQVRGELVYVGRGCPAAPEDPHGGTPEPDPYLADPAGKIALVDRTRQPRQPEITSGAGCPVADRARRAQAAGALAVVVAQTVEAAPTAFSPDGVPHDLSIPVLMIDKEPGDALRAALCPAFAEDGRCTPGERVAGALADGRGEWGGLRIIDLGDPAAPREVGVYRTPRSQRFPPPDLGVYSVQHAIARGGIAFVAWNSDGLRVLDLTSGAPREIAFFVPPDRPDPTGALPAKAYVTGVALLEPGTTPRAATYVVITDLHSGLYVLERNP